MIGKICVKNSLLYCKIKFNRLFLVCLMQKKLSASCSWTWFWFDVKKVLAFFLCSLWDIELVITETN